MTWESEIGLTRPMPKDLLWQGYGDTWLDTLYIWKGALWIPEDERSGSWTSETEIGDTWV